MSKDSGVAAWLAGQADRVIDTSCAQVFLTGDAAFKLKRPVDFGFLDFSTPQKRKWALDRELAFNRRTAPAIYRTVRKVTRQGESFALDGPGETVDYVLEMQRFDPDDVLCEHPERLDATLAERLGREIATMHAAAPAMPDAGGVKALGFTIRTNAEHLRIVAPRLGKAETLRLVDQTDAAFTAAAARLEARRAQGFGRHVHGDLHLGNILLQDGRPIPFDCIEFNDLLSQIDVQYDVAFTLMDLLFRGRGEAASRLLNGYYDQASRSFPPELADGLGLLPMMLAVRAGVRAHVSAQQGDDHLGRAYVLAGLAHLAPPPPRLLAIGGVSGTGKTTLARMIAPDVGAPPGALLLRSDEVRKRRFSLGPTDPLPPSAYAPAQMEHAYRAMLEEARRTLAGGWSVILDATFLAPEDRALAASLAADARIPLEGVWLTAPTAVLEARIAARAADASDATVETLRRQLNRGAGAVEWPTHDATDLAGVAKRITARPDTPHRAQGD